MWYQLAVIVVISYLPGAFVFRIPGHERWRRSEFRPEERTFWAVVISIAISSTVALGLAALELYRFERLLLVNVVLCVIIASRYRRRLLWDTPVRRLGVTALAPVALVCLGLWLYFPPSEYIIGGKDPGVYMNQGIQIAQRGSLVTWDHLVASLPPASRDLFVPRRDDVAYYGLRFMGYFVTDPDTGRIVGQFPHLYPIWIAIGYGIDGLTGARQTIGAWGILGVLALYFVGARLVGSVPAFAGAALLAVHVTQVWFSRYPNSELVLQAMLLAALLAFARAHIDDIRFFGPVAATLFGLSVFTRFSAVLGLMAVAVALLIGIIDDRRPRASFIVVLTVWLAAAGLYFGLIITPYAEQPIGFVRNLQPQHIALLVIGALAAGGFYAGARYDAFKKLVRRWLPATLVCLVVASAIYAYFFRFSAGRLAEHDAAALRTYAAYYVSPYGLAAALLGFVLVVRQSFWRGPALILTTVAFAFFFFYKVRVVPEHFWMARRFLPVILPASLLLIGAVAFSGVRRPWPSVPRQRVAYGVRFAIGLAFVLLLGRQFAIASGPILDHVEYAGIIPRLEVLENRFEDHDLLLVESRAASDVHVLALPLAYIYARNVLVLSDASPDKLEFLEFLTWARTQYEDVYFLGGGGTDLLSNDVAVTPVDSDRFQIPEYESPYNGYPRGVRFKAFDFGLYRFVPPVEARGPFILDVGIMDDLHVRRFHAKEQIQSSGVTFRWSRDRSFISIAGASADSRTATLWLSDGGRPPGVARARIQMFINETLLGEASLTSEFLPYSFDIPVEIAADMTRTGNTTPLLITANTWNPGQVLGTPDES